MSDLIEAMAESLDEVLGEPASYELTGKIYAALKPHMEAALRETHHLVPKDQEPVGWLYHRHTAPKNADPVNEFVQPNRANMDPRYWTETPLYALEKRHD